jgi:hypothetical protein
MTGKRSSLSSLLDRAPIPAGIHAVLENPIAVREWRVLRRHALDWRIWVGAKWTLDPVVWGAPVVLTYAVAPYALWLVLGTVRGLKLIPNERLPVDPFLILVIVFGFYTVSICQVLGATAVTHEREQQTWEQLWLTLLTGRERASGFYWGRLGPVVVAFAATMGAWWLLQPHYSALLRPFWPAVVSRGWLAVTALGIFLLSLLAGLVGLLASALSRQTMPAVVCSNVGFWHASWTLLTFLPFTVAPFIPNSGVGGGVGWLAASLISVVLIGLCLWGLWLGIASALTRHPVPVHRRATDMAREELNTRR